MPMLIRYLHILSLAVPIIAVLYLWYKRKGMEIDHIFLFSAGFIFYLILPFTLAESELISVHASYAVWKKAFDAITPQTWVWYFISVLLFYGAFIAGSVVGNKRSSLVDKAVDKVRNNIDLTAVNVFFIITMVFILLFGYQLREYFFFTYEKSTQIPVFDSFIAASVLLMSITACIIIGRYYRDKGKQPWRLLFHPAVISYVVVAILLTSMGGRIIVASSILMGFVFFSVYIRRLRLLVSLVLFLALVILAHFVYLWRAGATEYIFDIREYVMWRWWQGLFMSIFSENFNVGYSLLDFLGKYSIPLLRFPVVLLSNLIGLIPSFLFPAKVSWMVSFASLGYNVGGLSGGFNAYISLVVNFGILGASLFLFGLSYALQRLKHYSGPIAMAVYVMLSGWLGVLFFRNFEQTVIKQMLQFSILMPLALLILSRFIVTRRKNRN